MDKILVKAPEDSDECIKSFSFFHFLRESFSESEISVLVDEKNVAFFHYLKPLEMKVYSLPESERSILKLHRFAANLTNVFNINIFFDLEGTKSSASLGKFFRAEESFGYGDGLQKLLYDKFIEQRDPLDLLSLKVEREFTIRQVRGGVARSVKEIIDLPPYFVLFLDKLEDSKYRKFWKGFINSFSGRYFVLWHNSSDQHLNTFSNELDSKNDIRVLLDDDLENTEQFLINSTAVLSSMSWPLVLSSYLALDSFYFCFENEKFIRVPNFYAKPGLVEVKEFKKFFVDGQEKLNVVEWLEQECKL